MEKSTKIIVTIVAIVIFIIVFALINVGRQSQGHHTPGILGVVAMCVLIAALRAVWKSDKKDDDKKDDNDSSSILQK
jgi:hypothetical protein